MSAATPEQAKAGMSIEEMKSFIRNHFEEFVNRKNIEIGDVNFASNFVDHGADVPPGTPPGPEGAKQYVGNALKKLPDMKVTIEDMVAEAIRSWSGTFGDARIPRAARSCNSAGL